MGLQGYEGAPPLPTPRAQCERAQVPYPRPARTCGTVQFDVFSLVIIECGRPASHGLVERGDAAEVHELLLERLGVLFRHVLLEDLRGRLNKLLGLRKTMREAGKGSVILGLAKRRIIPSDPPIRAADSRSARAYGRERERAGNERTSTRFMLGMTALTSRITFALALASNDSSLTAKSVFSTGFSCEDSIKAGAASESRTAQVRRRR